VESIGQPGLLDPEARPGPGGLASMAIGVLLAVGAVVLVATGGDLLWIVLALVAAPLLIAVPVATARERARRLRLARLLPGWASAHGLVFRGRVPAVPATPLLRLPQSELTGAMEGPIADDPVALLAHHSWVGRQGRAQVAFWSSIAVVRLDDADGVRLRVGLQLPRWGGGAWLDGWTTAAGSGLGTDVAWQVELGEGHDPVRTAALLDALRGSGLLADEQPPLVEIDDGVLVVAYSGRVGVDAGMEDLVWFERLRDRAETWARAVASD
jgi:hypothetical protein